MNDGRDVAESQLRRISELELENAWLRQELAAANNTLGSGVYSGSDEGLSALFTDGVSQCCNSAFRRFFGIASDRAVTLEEILSTVREREVLQGYIRKGRNGQIGSVIATPAEKLYALVTLEFPYPGRQDRLVLLISDVSSWHQGELQLKREHAELETIFNNSMIGIIYIDMDRVIRRANKRAADVVGLASPEEAVGMSTFFFHLSADNFQQFTQFYDQLFTHKQTVELEFVFKRFDGGAIWAHLIGQALVDPQNPYEYSGTLWILEDITERRKAQLELEAVNTELEAYFENNIVAMMVVGIADTGEIEIVRVNSRMVGLFGFDNKDELVGCRAESLVAAAGEYQQFLRKLRVEPTDSEIHCFEDELVGKNNKRVWVSGSGQILNLTVAADRQVNAVFIFDDTTEKREDRQALERVNAELETYFDNSMVGVMITDGEYRVYRANQRLADILGYAGSDELIGRVPLDFAAAALEARVSSSEFEGLLQAQSVKRYEFKLVKPDGETVWVGVAGKPIDKTVPADLNRGIVWVVDDVTARKVAEEKLVKLATIDELTGVNNRRSFLLLCNRLLERARKCRKYLALFMIDLDHFKMVNDNYGHATGDETLRHFAEVCSRSLRPIDIFGRIGGEEFAVLLPDITIDEAETIANRLRIIVKGAFEQAPQGLSPMTISIGVCIVAEGEGIEEALKKADMALYAAKNQGRNRVVCWQK